MRRDLADQRDVLFFYLAVISYANLACKVKQAKTKTTCAPRISFTAWSMSGSVIKTFADERLLASNLSISFSPSYHFGVAVKGESVVLETYPSPRR